MKRSINICMALAVISCCFASCLKDDAVTDYNDIQAIVIVPNANWPKATAVTAVKVGATETYTSAIYARISWDKPLTKDVTVTFAEDAAAIGAYNTAFKTTYVALNADAYKLSSKTVIIKAGTNDASIPLEVYGAKIDFVKNNMLSFSITDAGGQKFSSNYKTYLIPIAKK